MQVPPQAIDLVRAFEGCLQPTGDGRFRAYPDPAHGWDVPTIGWGTIAYPDGTRVRRGDIITQARADELLAWEAEKCAESVQALVHILLTPDQFSALISFTYNLGPGALKRSTLLKKLNAAADYKGAANEFARWNRAGGKVLRGLTRRRLSERNLFLGKRPYIVAS